MTDHSSPLSLHEQIGRLARNCVYRYAVNYELTPEDEHELIMIGVQSARLTLDAVEAEARTISTYWGGVRVIHLAVIRDLRAQLTGSLPSSPAEPTP